MNGWEKCLELSALSSLASADYPGYSWEQSLDEDFSVEHDTIGGVLGAPVEDINEEFAEDEQTDRESTTMDTLQYEPVGDFVGLGYPDYLEIYFSSMVAGIFLGLLATVLGEVVGFLAGLLKGGK